MFFEKALEFLLDPRFVEVNVEDNQVGFNPCPQPDPGSGVSGPPGIDLIFVGGGILLYLILWLVMPME